MLFIEFVFIFIFYRDCFQGATIGVVVCRTMKRTEARHLIRVFYGEDLLIKKVYFKKRNVFSYWGKGEFWGRRVRGADAQKEKKSSKNRTNYYATIGKICVLETTHLVAEMRGPDRRKRTEAVDGLRVADEADADHRRALDDGDGLRGLLLVELRPRLIHVAHDVRHAGLVAHEGGKVAPAVHELPGSWCKNHAGRRLVRQWQQLHSSDLISIHM